MMKSKPVSETITKNQVNFQRQTTSNLKATIQKGEYKPSWQDPINLVTMAATDNLPVFKQIVTTDKIVDLAFFKGLKTDFELASGKSVSTDEWNPMTFALMNQSIKFFDYFVNTVSFNLKGMLCLPSK